MIRGWMIFDGTQYLSQLGRPELAGSTGPVAISGEADFGHVAEIKPTGIARIF